MPTGEKPDLSEFIALGKRPKPPCQIALVLENGDLAAGDKAALVAALEQPRAVISATAIEKWLEKRGITTNRMRISNHRRGVCNCASP